MIDLQQLRPARRAPDHRLAGAGRRGRAAAAAAVAAGAEGMRGPEHETTDLGYGVGWHRPCRSLYTTGWLASKQRRPWRSWLPISPPLLYSPRLLCFPLDFFLVWWCGVGDERDLFCFRFGGVCSTV